MSHLLPFPIENFEAYCNALQRVGVSPGFVLYTNHHASNHQPAARLLPATHLGIAQAYLSAPSDDSFRDLVETGVLFDTEWDRKTSRWEIVSFQGWEVLHTAFSRLHIKTKQSLQDLTGDSEFAFTQ